MHGTLAHMPESRDAVLGELRLACDELRNQVSADRGFVCTPASQVAIERLVAKLVRELLPDSESGEPVAGSTVEPDVRRQLARDLLLAADLVVRMTEAELA